MSDCTFDDHFMLVDGVMTPQPWMQHRQVASVSAVSKTESFAPSLGSGNFLDLGSSVGNIGTLFGSQLGGLGGLLGSGAGLGSLGGLFGGGLGGGLTSPTASAVGNKNILIHSITRSWLNNTPIDQYVYGLITRGGARVTLQARSRAYLVVQSGFRQHTSDPGPLAISSQFGCGADMGKGGLLATATGVCVIEERMQSCTFPLAPERTGWYRLPPGETFTAKVEVRFASEFWENNSIDGGASGLESGYTSGDTRLDLFAIPVI